jgi:hypothetical protein
LDPLHKDGSIPDSFEYKGQTLLRAHVKGAMTDVAIKKACNDKGMKPVCDKASYCNGQCIPVGGSTEYFHFSAANNNLQYGIPTDTIRGSFFYTGEKQGDRGVWSLQNIGTGSHRQSNIWDKNGDTWCAVEDLKKKSFTFLGYEFTRVTVKSTGMKNSDILKACAAIGQKPVCDYPTSSYNDGKCEKVKSYNW